MKSNEFEKILEKFEMKNLKDFSINYLETDSLRIHLLLMKKQIVQNMLKLKL